MFGSLFDSPGSLAGILLICALSGCAQGMTGFGFGIVAMSTLPLVLDAQTAGILVVLLTLLVTVKTFHLHWREFRIERIRGLLIGSVLGAVVGSFFLVEVDAAVFRRSLGAALLLMGLYDLLFAGRRRLRCPEWLGFPLGALSGVLGGAFNMGGPPAVIYLYSQGWPRATVIASLQAGFFATVVVRILVVALSGHLSGEMVSLGFLAIVPSLLGLWVGGRLIDRVSQGRFQMMISVFIIVVSIKYLFY